ncbi:MAG: TetR/AcrR family transcriptional regulator, partial [Chloroflexota bacterium]
QVTVEELAQRADVSRATFYLHYRDKDELLLDYFSGIVASRIQRFADFPLSALRAEMDGLDQELLLPLSERPIAGIFQHAAEHAALYRLALREDCASRVAGQLQQITVTALDDLLHNKVKEAGLETGLLAPLDLVAHTFVAAFLACLTWWLDQGMPYPPQQMAQIFRTLFFPGIRRAFGID